MFAHRLNIRTFYRKNKCQGLYLGSGRAQHPAFFFATKAPGHEGARSVRPLVATFVFLRVLVPLRLFKPIALKKFNHIDQGPVVGQMNGQGCNVQLIRRSQVP
jgi:hypothetical protein